MVILIAGASHAGKTLLAQRMLEEYGYPHLSIDHQNALWALRRVAEVWGGEVTSVITVANGRSLRARSAWMTSAATAYEVALLNIRGRI